MEDVQYNGISRIIIASNIIEWQDNNNERHQDTCGNEPAEVKEILKSFHIDSTNYSHAGDLCVITFDQNKKEYVLHTQHHYHNNGDTEVHVSVNPDENGSLKCKVETHKKYDKNNVQREEPKTDDDRVGFNLDIWDAVDKKKNATVQELAELKKEIQTLTYMLENIKMRLAMLQLQQASRGNQNSL